MIRFQTSEETHDASSGETKKESPRESLLTKALALLILGWVRNYQRKSIDLIKIEAVSYYVKGVGGARKVFLGHILFNGLLFLLLAGFFLVHAGLFLYMDWSIKTKGLIFLGLGAVYFLLALWGILRYSSQKKWMELSGASDLVTKITHK